MDIITEGAPVFTDAPRSSALNSLIVRPSVWKAANPVYLLLPLTNELLDLMFPELKFRVGVELMYLLLSDPLDFRLTDVLLCLG